MWDRIDSLVISIKHPSLKLQGQEIAFKNCVQAWCHDTQRNDTQPNWLNGTAREY